VLAGDAAQAPLGATVAIELTNADDATQAEVPLGAIYDRGAGPGVWLINPDKKTISYRPVKVKLLGEETAVLSSGLAVGDIVVAMGGPELHDGETVRFATSQATP
jgi:multidrug efflux pump subunit AcrA (membrane-fusion protein)